VAEDFHLPGGGYKKPPQLVAGHNVHWFDAAERGMGWRDMIRALTAAGVNGRGGKPLSVGTLSSALRRKRAETEDVMSRADRQARLALPEPIPESQPVRSRKASPKKDYRNSNSRAITLVGPIAPIMIGSAILPFWPVRPLAHSQIMAARIFNEIKGL
jgi:hypothetical protein